jgi:alpha-beta hydrolase superfamily lysophospholipase
VLIALADQPDEERRARRDAETERLMAGLKRAEVKEFAGAPHDIHVDRPKALSEWMLDALQDGFFG